MRRFVPLAVLALLLAAGWWMLSAPDRDTGDEPVAVGARDAPEAAPPPARLAAAGHATSMEPVPLETGPPPPPPAPLDSEPPRGTGRIEGHVVDAATEEPAGGAWVLAFTDGVADPPPKAVSDEEGRYALADVPAGSVLLVVLGGGWHGVDLADLRESFAADAPSGSVPLKSDESLDVPLRAVRAAVVEGRVLDGDGELVAGAHVRPLATPRSYDSWSPPADLHVARADADGAYRFDTLVSGLEYRVEATSETTAAARSAPFRPMAAAPTRIDVHLPPARFLDLLVVSAAKEQPLLSAIASHAAPDPVQRFRTNHQEWEAGEDGRIHVGPLPPGALDLQVRADGYVSATVHLEPEDVGSVERRVELADGLVIAGRISARGDVPAEDAWLVCRRGETSNVGHTDSEGGFRFEGLEPGTWHLDITIGNGTADESLEVEAGEEDLRIEVDVALTPGLVLHVLGPDGKPVPRFEAATATTWTCGVGEAIDGLLELAAGQDCEWIEIRRAKDAEGNALPYAPVTIDVRARDGSERTVHLAKGASIQGRVLGSDDAGVAGLEVTATSEQASPCPMLSGAHAQTQTSPDGSFRLLGLGSGPHRVYVSVPSRFAPVSPVNADAGATDVTIRLEPATDVRPVVVGPDGAPVARARVQVSSMRGGGLCWELTGDDGRVLLTGLSAAGHYSLEVRPPEDRTDLACLDKQAWSPSDEPIALGPAARFAGQVVDDDGRPVANCQVIGYGQSEMEFGASESDADGRFVLTGLPPGPKRLIAFGPGEPRRVSPVVHVTDATEHGIRITVTPVRKLVLRLEGVPATLTGRPVNLRPQGLPESSSSGVIQEDGAVGIDVHPDGLYDLHFVARDDRLVAWREGIRGDAGTVSVSVVPSHEMRGRVLAPPEALRTKVRVRDRGVRAYATPDADGSFVLRGLPPGTWTVHAEVFTPAGTRTKEMKAAAGGHVSIDLRD